MIAVDEAAAALVAAIRRGEGPRLLLARTYRLFGHTSTDPAAWRAAHEVEAARGAEPIARLAAVLRERGVAEAELQAVAEEARAEMDAARRQAREAPWPEAALAYRDVQDAGAPAWTR